MSKSKDGFRVWSLWTENSAFGTNSGSGVIGSQSEDYESEGDSTVERREEKMPLNWEVVNGMEVSKLKFITL